MKHLFVIDDSGSPGNFNQSLFIKEDRITLVAVFIHSEIRDELDKIIKKIGTLLKSHHNIDRLHFKDLINKNNEYSNFKNVEVVSLMETVSRLISQFDLPYFVQTCHSNTLRENGMIFKKDFIVDKLNMSNNYDAAFYLLMMKIKLFLEKNYPNEVVEIVIDQGRKKAGVKEEFITLNGLTSNSEVLYESSIDYSLLQIADYFAYSINRMQMTAIKENKTDFDVTITEFISIAIGEQYSEGVSIIQANPKEITKDDYDYEQYKQRQVDGNLNKWKKMRE